ncbi:MAG: Rqc2 family fibronectin-binding protein [Fusobacteriaceae bacterium]
MFYLDGISLHKIIEEFSSNLVGKKIGKISQETENSVTLSFGKVSLVISCNNSLPICFLSNEKSFRLNEEFNFVLSLRKYFSNALLEKIEQIGMDRILCFSFKKLDELGVIHIYKLYFEIMGKHSNLIIVNFENKILDLIKKIPIEENRLRVLLPGAEYFQPIISKKNLPLSVTEENFENFKNIGLVASLEGVGKNLALTISNFEDLKNILNSISSPKCYLKEKKIILATVLFTVKPQFYDEVIPFQTFSELVEFYLEKNALSSSFEILLNKITRATNTKIKKIEKILINIEKDNIEKNNLNEYKEIGDILAANIYSIPKFISQVELYNFYTDKMIDIALNKTHSIQRNIESYYKKYNKLKRGLEANKIRKIEVQKELDYLNSILTFTKTVPTVENLKNIIEELENQKYLKKSLKDSKKIKKNKKKISLGVSIIDEFFTIIYGRNNIENDYITFKIGAKDDFWFHAKDIPGSHVILKCNENNLTPELIEKAASYAANFSRGNLGDKISVDYTRRKYVTKPNGSKPGFVIYTNQKTINVIKEEL